MSHELQETINRWKTYLQKIEQRFDQSLQQAEETCKDLLVESNYDYYEVMKTWMAIKSQIYDISKSVTQTWEQKVFPQLRLHTNFDLPSGLHESDFTLYLINKLEQFERKLEADLSQTFYNHAIQSANQQFFCTQCHSPLVIKSNIFRAHYVTCNYCQATNTFTPDTKYAQIGGNIIDNIVAKKCEHLYQQMQNSLNVIQNQRPPVAEQLWDKYKADYFYYYEAYFTERMKLNEDVKDRFDADMQRKKTEYQQYENLHKKSY
ncbi:hypothetical protein [Pedobacter sp. SL55]|uniref:hypothetical protein n=1 Tax=Pedobacter sp. SL55 TaxID=2995161 RepID=UPI00226FD693|nr:hypothetical protein [Pedobacter sp. SL55]WAC42564.1 hypothetical protein OVA16_09480 [Pedobacter sp. SL55]